MAIDATWALDWIARSQVVLAENRERLIDLDRQIGDGDHGENMDRGFSAVEKVLSAEPPTDVPGVLKVVAKTLMSTVGGAAGPLYGTAFLRAAKAAPEGVLDAQDVAALLAAALEGIQARGKAEPGDKTMVDAWAPAVAAAREIADGGGSPEEVLDAAARAAADGAQSTEPLRARKGRASYLGERSMGHLDPGAVSSQLILAAAAKAGRA
ncbi:MAG: dihydroxyacetone kinase subunit L [Propionibacterium sp.]|nr:dihydroxyacetone kinase subunit L [Propionibacterium sp.]MDN6565976.1 dihydroxyacetone kinase subunit L [Actinomyces sp.]MDN6794847.1 dihydroxyacetone kinase subunit L [Propionibacterium sp.]